MADGNVTAKVGFAAALSKSEPCKRTRKYRKRVKRAAVRKRRRDERNSATKEQGT